MEGIGGYVQALARGAVVLGWLCVVTAPLALWKLIDIIIWLAQHVRWAG